MLAGNILSRTIQLACSYTVSNCCLFFKDPSLTDQHVWRWRYGKFQIFKFVADVKEQISEKVAIANEEADASMVFVVNSQGD